MITGEKTVLRAIERDDVHKLWEWTQDEEIMKLRNYLAPPKSFESAMKEYEDGLKEEESVIRLAIVTLAGELIGETALRDIDPRIGDAEFTIAIGNRSYWGHGYGSDVVWSMMAYAFHQLNLHRVTLYVHDWNTRAIKSYEKCGFKEEGRFREAEYIDGRYSDVLAMGLLKSEFEQKEIERAEASGRSLALSVRI